MLKRLLVLLLCTPLTIASCLGDANDAGTDGVAGPLGGGPPDGTGAAPTEATGGASAGASAGGMGGMGGDAVIIPEAPMGGAWGEDVFVTVWDPWAGGALNYDEWPGSLQLPLTDDGTYDFFVFWGDGSSGHVTTDYDQDAVHTYAEQRTYEVIIQGRIEGWHFRREDADRYPNSVSWITDAVKLLEIKHWGSFRFGPSGEGFRGATKLEITADDMPDLSRATSLEFAFAQCENIEEIPNLEAWDTSSVTSMAGMFAGVAGFNQDLSAWDTSQVTDMSWMFHGASAFNQDLSGWDVSQVIAMNGLFSHATAFDQDLSAWDTSNVRHMEWMFGDASAFNQELSAWDTSSVEDMESMFAGAAAFNQDLSAWDTSSVETMYAMFAGATNFNQDLSAWDTSSVEDMGQMFANAVSFNQDISSWNVSSVYFDESYDYEYDDDYYESWYERGTSRLGFMHMLNGATSFSTSNYDALLIGWAAQTTQTDVLFSAGTTQYTAAAAAARAVLTDERGWTITDGGLLP